MDVSADEIGDLSGTEGYKLKVSRVFEEQLIGVVPDMLRAGFGGAAGIVVFGEKDPL